MNGEALIAQSQLLHMLCMSVPIYTECNIEVCRVE